jgi:NADH:ubiquinone oxidoreductase subunit K
MYNYLLLNFISKLLDILLFSFSFYPLIFLISFFFLTTFNLYYCLRNIFKIFFLTEISLLTVVVFLAQLSSIYPDFFTLNYFYCQLILATAAAEAALFLGLFSYLYDQQFLN